MKQSIPDLGAFIREQRERRALSVRRLADLAGVSNPYLSQIERGLRRPSAEILRGISRALAIPVEALYERAGLLDGTRTLGVLEAIAADERLTEDQKEALTKTYRSFVGEEDT